MNKDLVYYLASPYTHNKEYMEATRAASVALAAGKLIAEGYTIFCPIAMSHYIKEHAGLGGSFKEWEQLDLAILDKCDALIVLTLDGWTESVGVSAEIAAAKRQKKQIIYRHFDENEIKWVLSPSEFWDIEKVLGFGAMKYGPDNWLRKDGCKSSEQQMIDSAFHHLSDARHGLKDEESGLSAELHAAVRLLMLYTRRQRGLK